jgi:hypothetical protein
VSLAYTYKFTIDFYCKYLGCSYNRETQSKVNSIIQWLFDRGEFETLNTLILQDWRCNHLIELWNETGTLEAFKADVLKPCPICSARMFWQVCPECDGRGHHWRDDSRLPGLKQWTCTWCKGKHGWYVCSTCQQKSLEVVKQKMGDL